MENIKPTTAERLILNPLNKFISHSTTGGIILFLAALIAIIWANSPYKETYHHIWENKIGFSFNGKIIEKTIHHWINDGLMAIFFFVVGLELKREIIGGELSDVKKAALPIIAALGGMIVPALIYILFNAGGMAQHGWGIPMATDIAFALGVLFLLGDKVPLSLKIFLTALAIADDLGAVLVIAFFYTSEISFLPLLIGGGVVLLLLFANKIGVRYTPFYSVIGLSILWAAFLLSGVHATIAGVLVAFTIPSVAKIDETIYANYIQKILYQIKALDRDNRQKFITEKQLGLLDEVKKSTVHVIPPLQKIEHALHPFVTFVIMPVFAFANAGVTLDGNVFKIIQTPVALGVIFGLLIGKFIGVVGFSLLANRLKIAKLPQDMKLKHLFAAGLLASIGFTMSLFVTELAFDEEQFIMEAKVAIIVASLIGGILGSIYLKKTL